MSALDRLPASTPLVSLSPLVQGNDVIAIGGEQFTVAKLEEAPAQIEYEDGRIRWVTDLIAGVVGREGENRG